MFGIELLNATEQLQAEDDGSVLVINEAAGQGVSFPLAVGEKPARYGTSRKKGPGKN